VTGPVTERYWFVTFRRHHPSSLTGVGTPANHVTRRATRSPKCSAEIVEVGEISRGFENAAQAAARRGTEKAPEEASDQRVHQPAQESNA